MKLFKASWLVTLIMSTVYVWQQYLEKMPLTLSTAFIVTSLSFYCAVKAIIGWFDQEEK